MTELFAFLLGSCLTWWLLRTRREPSRTLPVPRVVAPVSDGDRAELADIAHAVGAELANLTTGVEGHARLLCEAIGKPSSVAVQAERLFMVVRKLRLLSEKMQWSARPPRLALEQTDVAELLGSLRHEIEAHTAGHVRVKCMTGSALPRAMADGPALSKAILFLAEALLEIEPEASVLGLSASTHVEDDVAPSIEIVVQVETEARTEPHGDRPERLPLGRKAAENVLHSLGAQLRIEHCDGLRCTAHVRLPAADRPARVPVEPKPRPPRDPHPFGGVLILEAEPSVRSMIQHEIERSGRRTVCCADAAAARALLTATPERFELLILDAGEPGGPRSRLVAQANELCPGAATLVLTPDDGAATADSPTPYRDRLALHKPFGIADLRRVLVRVLKPFTDCEMRAGAVPDEPVPAPSREPDRPAGHATARPQGRKPDGLC